MYCFQCGAPGVASFCPACGQDQSALPGAQPSADKPAGVHWSDSIDYETVIADPEVRSRLATIRPRGLRALTGEDLLAVFDAVSPIGFSLGKLTTAIIPIYDRLGIKTQHQSEAWFDAPVGRVMLAVLSSLATRSLPIAEVQQGAAECMLSSEIPAGLTTYRGKINVLLAPQGASVRVSLASTISAQWYDWGKSKRLQQAILGGIATELDAQGFRQEAKQRVA